MRRALAMGAPQAAVARMAPSGAPVPNAVQLDWHLWRVGEDARHTMPAHHRTTTIFY